MKLLLGQKASLKMAIAVLAICYDSPQNLCFAQTALAITHEITSPSKISISVMKNGTYSAESTTVNFVAYQAIPDGWKVHQVFPPRIATIKTTYIASNDDERTSVSVSVDDVSGHDIKRVSEFSDPGDTGKVVGGQIFVTTIHACCEAPAVHSVRFLETGKLLFRTSGDTELGAAAWAEIPDVFPHVDRWAAFEAAGIFDKENDQHVIGFMTYGDLKGELSKVVIRSKVTPKVIVGLGKSRTLRQDAAECGFVVWLVPGSDANKPNRPARGECSHFPGGTHISTELWPLAHQRGDPILSGFVLEFSVLGRVYATIPIVNDRFDLTRAHIEPDLRIEAIDGSRKQSPLSTP